MVDQYGRWYPDFPGQQPWQDPAYMRAVGQTAQPHQTQATNQPAQQDMTPVIHMDIKQVDSIEAISKVQPAPGTTGAYMTKDDKVIVFRTMYANGEYTDRVYDERPPAPPAPKFDPAEYVRRDELSPLVAAAIAKIIPPKREDDE